MHAEFPIIIGGASLAGMTAALRLKQLGYRPLVLDRDRFPRPKLCGEFLGPDSFSCLEQLGLLDAVKEQAYEPVRNVMFYSTSGKILSINLSWMNRDTPYGLAISRERLDYLLVEAARKQGISIEEQCRILPAIINNGHAFELTVQANAKSFPSLLETPMLLDATGRHGGLYLAEENVNRPVEIARRFKNMIGIQCHAITGALKDSHLRMFFFPGGYGGIQPLGPNLINICLLTRLHGNKTQAINASNIKSRLLETMGQNPVAAEILNTCVFDEDVHTTANLNLNLHAEETQLLQIGDAMITIDPFTGSGMAHALETGLMAADTIAVGMQHHLTYEEVRKRYARQYQKRFGLRLKLLRSFRPLLFSKALQEISWPVIRPMLPALTAVFR